MMEVTRGGKGGGETEWVRPFRQLSAVLHSAQTNEETSSSDERDGFSPAETGYRHGTVHHFTWVERWEDSFVAGLAVFLNLIQPTSDERARRFSTVEK